MSHLLPRGGRSLAVQSITAAAAVLYPVLTLICAAGGPVIRRCWEAGCLHRPEVQGSPRRQQTGATPCQQANSALAGAQQTLGVGSCQSFRHLEAALTATESCYLNWASENASVCKVAWLIACIAQRMC